MNKKHKGILNRSWRRVVCCISVGLVAAGCTMAESQLPTPTTGPIEAPIEATAEPTLESTDEPTLEPIVEATVEPITEPTVEAGNAMPPSSESDQHYAVYAAVINELYATEVDATGEGTQYVLLAETEDALRVAGTVEQLETFLRQSFGDALAEETLADFVAKQADRTPLARHDALGVETLGGEVEVINRADLESLVSESGEWQMFFEAYPQASGVISFSPVGFGATGEQALALTGFAGDFGSGQGYYVLLTLQDGMWAVNQSVVAWVN